MRRVLDIAARVRAARKLTPSSARGHRRGAAGVLGGLGIAAVLGATIIFGASTAVGAGSSVSRSRSASDAGCAGEVRTAEGSVCGVLADGDLEYLGIPYAAPPTGALRWRPPQPPANWESPLQATQPGRHCIGSRTGSEDCLWLNVYIPHGGGTELPVMVWIHGGGFDHDDDSGNGAGTDVGSGQDLANREHVIVVRLSYRLGAFGFLASRALGDASGDYGLQDQHAALMWVRRDIAAFGGDSNNVTVFGQSAGGTSTCLQLLAPRSRGLFRRAIVQSGQYQSFFSQGSCAQTLQSVGQAEATTRTLAARVGCESAPNLAACLRGVSAEALLTPIPKLGSFRADW
jgi:para-nitrobenzyl esterase